MKQICYEELQGQRNKVVRIEYEAADSFDRIGMVRFAQEVIDTHFQRNGGLERVSVLEVGEEQGREVLEEVKECWYQLSELGTFQKDLARIIIAGHSHLLSAAFQVVLFRDSKKILILSPEVYFFEKNGKNALDEMLAAIETRVEEEKLGMQKVTRNDYLRAADYWKEKDELAEKDGKKVEDRDELLKDIEAFIASKKICALATGAESAVRCTPLEYMYFDGSFWIFSEGGQKFANLLKNKNVSLAIFNDNADFSRIRSLQVTGEACVVDYFSKKYNAAAERRGISVEKLRRMEHPMNLIEISPVVFEYIDAEYRSKGLDIRQTVKC